MDKVIKITTDNNVKEVCFDLDNYGELYSALGGYPTIVRTKTIYKFCGSDVVMIVDDDGFQKKLAPNLVGSLMYTPGMIVGDVLFCKEVGAELVGFRTEEVFFLRDKFIKQCECIRR